MNKYQNISYYYFIVILTSLCQIKGDNLKTEGPMRKNETLLTTKSYNFSLNLLGTNSITQQTESSQTQLQDILSSTPTLVHQFKPYQPEWIVQNHHNHMLKRPEPKFYEIERQDASGAQGTCNYKQTCKQTVTGRNLPYSRSLQIIQSEEYLSAVDKDIIRRNFQFSLYQKFDNPSEQDVHSRKKRAVSSSVAQYVASYLTLCAYYTTNGYTAFWALATSSITSICNGLSYGAYPSGPEIPTTAGILSCNFALVCVENLASPNTVVAASTADCVTYMTTLTSFMIPSYCPTSTSASIATSVSTSTPAPLYVIGKLPFIPIAHLVVTAVIGGAFMSIPPLKAVSRSGVPQSAPQPGTPNGGSFPNLIDSSCFSAFNVTPIGFVPTDVPQPGTPNGGDSPNQVNSSCISALSLVPPGLVPVAIFPPFATPRTFPAEAVIFAEDPNILDKDFVPGRFRRSLNVRRKYRAPSFFERALNKMGGLSSAFSITKRFRDLRREITCLRTRIDVYSKQFKASLKKRISRHNYHSSYNVHTDYNYETQKRKERADYRKREFDIKDCFANYPEPLYGFRVRVTVTEDSPCILGDTCRGSPDEEDPNSTNSDAIDESLQSEPLDEYDRQSGEDFRSDAPLDCRVTCNRSSG